jgi:hypothetical protein
MPPCPHCSSSKDAVEVAGQLLHTYSDRWISCSGKDRSSQDCSGKDQPPARNHAFAKAILWLQLAMPLHHVHHLFHLIRSRF